MKGNQHLTVTNGFHSRLCKTDFLAISLARIAADAANGDGGDDDGDASNGDACAIADTLVAYFECLTYALEPPVELSSKHSTFLVECSTVAVERKATRWDCCCTNSKRNS